MEISVLCKVVDNFGDIGVVWRLCKQIKANYPETKLNLIVDDFVAFNKICSSVNVDYKFQNVDAIDIYDWKNFEFCYETFTNNDGEKLSLILECFQCGRPDWMEKILFEDKLQRTVQVIMIDYLTAEDYAESFHCLQSLTRSGKVKKVNFMPGFTDKTGGLIIDELWKKEPSRNPNGSVLIFTYERNWKPLVNGINNWAKTKDIFPEILIAPGRGFDSMKNAWSDIGEKSLNCCVKELSFMNQNQWDLMMKDCSILIIRGEESMSRACLSGIPFVWHAYPQSDEYQLVKVNALLNRMERHFKYEDFEIVKKLWIAINSPETDDSDFDLESYMEKFLQNADRLEYGFKEFSKSLQKNGDLVTNLMTFINKNIIIEVN